MKLKTNFFLFIICFAITFHNGFGQQYNFRQYNVQDGLAHSQVSPIVQDAKGFIWIPTLGGGISKFDGKIFVNYTEKEGLSSNLIRCSLVDKKGNIWLGTAGGGVSMFDGKVFKRVDDSTSKVDDVVYSLIEDAEGLIWIASNKGVFTYDANLAKSQEVKFTHINKKYNLPELPVKTIFQDSKKRIWFSVWDSGLYCISENKVSHFTEKDGLTSPCVTIIEDEKGEIWFGLKNGVIKVNSKNEKIELLRFDNIHLNEIMIYSLLEDKFGNIWFGTQSAGLIKYNPKTKISEKITTKNGLPTNDVLGLMEDFEGNIWMSCWGYGAVKYSGSMFVHYITKDGLLGNYGGALIQLSNNDLLVNSGTEISRVKPNGTILPFEQKVSSKIYALHKSKSDIVYVATDDGLISFENGKKKIYSEKDNLLTFPPTTLVEDKTGKIWCSSLFGKLSSFDGENFVNYSEKDGLKPDYIYSIYVDSKDNVWICTWAAGLCKFDGKKFTYYTKKDGLASDNIMTLLEDDKGLLWIGTYGGGLSVYDGKEFKTISSKDGMSDDAVVAMVFDKANDLWIATTKGLNRLNSNEYRSTGKIIFRVYGKSEGLAEIECNRNAAFKSVDGNIWFGTKTGLTKYTSDDDHMNKIEPFTHITNIQLFFENADWTKLCDSINETTNLPYQLSLDYTNNHLTFNFIGISTTVPEKVLYKYMLEGVDKSWSPPTDKTSATYSGLSHGSYVFKVMACNNEGIYNQNATTFEFVITPPFWKRTWFYVLCVIVVIGGFYIYVKLQTKKLARENKILEEKVEERTAEVVKKKDELEYAYHEIEEKNRDIMDSINYAKRIQYTILANEELLKENIPNHFILFQPKDIVSGDFYWATKKDNKFYLAVCDSTGHGVPGAFMSLLNISFLNEAISEKNISEPNEILNYVRERLITSVSKDGAQDGMDGILLCIDKENNEITYAAALNAPVLVSDGKLIQLSADKMPIGKGERMNSFTLFNIEMKAEDVLYLYTDGYADQFGGASGKKFKYKQLHQLLLTNNTKSLNEQNNIYLKTINDWKGNLEQVDDILVIGIKI